MSEAKRIPVSTRCDPEVWDAARAATAGMMRINPGYSLSQLVEDALRHEVIRLSTEHHGGEPWPAAEALRRGRRI